jgi:hypothetical protein
MPILGIIASSEKNVPNAPTIGTATDIGTGRAYNDGAASVTFTAPSFNGKLPITSYTVTSSPGGFTASGASSPLTVTGLASSTSYTFTVKATNGVGQSAASAASNSITATTVPQAPTIGTATAGSGSATVTYTANATGGKAVSAYTATSSPGSITGTGASPITVSGLTNGTAYTFTVTATNANGTSTASAASNSVTPVVPSSFESIATVTSGSTITFSSIPSGYKSLQIRVYGASSFGRGLSITFNGDTSASYKADYWLTTSTPSPSSNSAMTSIQMAALVGGPAPAFGCNIFDVFDYTSNKIKTIYHQGGNSTDASYGIGGWNSTAAITSITFTFTMGGLQTGSSMALYGVK